MAKEDQKSPILPYNAEARAEGFSYEPDPQLAYIYAMAIVGQRADEEGWPEGRFRDEMRLKMTEVREKLEGISDYGRKREEKMRLARELTEIERVSVESGKGYLID